jgi:hypothetical protein
MQIKFKSVEALHSWRRFRYHHPILQFRILLQLPQNTNISKVGAAVQRSTCFRFYTGTTFTPDLNTLDASRRRVPISSGTIWFVFTRYHICVLLGTHWVHLPTSLVQSGTHRVCQNRARLRYRSGTTFLDGKLFIYRASRFTYHQQNLYNLVSRFPKTYLLHY